MAHAAARNTRGFRDRHRSPRIGAPFHRTLEPKHWAGEVLQWEGEGLDEQGRRADTGAVVVRIDPRYFRPAEVETLAR